MRKCVVEWDQQIPRITSDCHSHSNMIMRQRERCKALHTSNSMYSTTSGSWLWSIPAEHTSHSRTTHFKQMKWKELASLPGSVFSIHEIFPEMENKGLVVEFWIDLSSQDRGCWFNQPVSWCHCSKDRVGNLLKRQDISNKNNSDFRSRVLNDLNMQMRLGKTLWYRKSLRLRALRVYVQVFLL